MCMPVEGNTVDPIVEITVLNEKKYSAAKDNVGGTGTCTWNEHIFFEPRNLVRYAAILKHLLDSRSDSISENLD